MSRSEIRSGPYESSGFFLAPRDTFDSTVVKHTRIHAIDHDAMEIRIVATGDDGGRQHTREFSSHSTTAGARGARVRGSATGRRACPRCSASASASACSAPPDPRASRQGGACVEIKILRRVRAESSRRPPRHRHDACSMAWRCRFLAARPSQVGRVIADCTRLTG